MDRNNIPSQCNCPPYPWFYSCICSNLWPTMIRRYYIENSRNKQVTHLKGHKAFFMLGKQPIPQRPLLKYKDLVFFFLSAFYICRQCIVIILTSHIPPSIHSGFFPVLIFLLHGATMEGGSGLEDRRSMSWPEG